MVWEGNSGLNAKSQNKPCTPNKYHAFLGIFTTLKQGCEIVTMLPWTVHILYLPQTCYNVGATS